MSYNQIVTQAPSTTSASDGTFSTAIAGKQGEALLSQVHGKYYTQSYRGNVYWGSTAAAGLTLALVTTGAGASVVFILWNPQGSGKNLSLIRCSITPTTAMTAGDGYAYGFLLNAGAGVGTAAPLSSFTAITATRGSAVIGATGQGNSVALLGGGATFTGNPSFMRGTGFSGGTAAITVPATQAPMIEDFDGTMIVPPGVLFALGTTIVTSGQSATQASFIWEETPL